MQALKWRGGGAAFRGSVAAADPARDRRSDSARAAGSPTLASEQHILIIALYFRSWPASCRPSTPSNAQNKVVVCTSPKGDFLYARVGVHHDEPAQWHLVRR